MSGCKESRKRARPLRQGQLRLGWQLLTNMGYIQLYSYISLRYCPQWRWTMRLGLGWCWLCRHQLYLHSRRRPHVHQGPTVGLKACHGTSMSSLCSEVQQILRRRKPDLQGRLGAASRSKSLCSARCSWTVRDEAFTSCCPTSSGPSYSTCELDHTW